MNHAKLQATTFHLLPPLRNIALSFVMLAYTSVILITPSSFAQACTTYSADLGPNIFSKSDYTDHVTGNHNDKFGNTATCSYSGIYGPCGVTVNTTANEPVSVDTGGIKELLGSHVSHYAMQSGSASANAGPATAYAAAASAWQYCLLSGCAFDVSINGGGPYTFSWPPGDLFNDSYQTQYTCVAEIGICTPPSQCQCFNESGGGGCGGDSPIIIDTTGQGFHLTDPNSACVTFDIKGNGKPVCLSWPKHGSRNAWLSLPKPNANGELEVTTGKELFGNFTPQKHHPNPKNPNGFLALAEYDLVDYGFGGNGNGMIDPGDKVWPNLRLWIDEHCYLKPEQPCTSLPSELHRLDDFAIQNIGLVYGYDPNKHDEWGNRYKFFGHLNVMDYSEAHPSGLSETSDTREIWDVYLNLRTTQTMKQKVGSPELSK